MTDNDLIRKSDALEAVAGWEIPSTAIAALSRAIGADDLAERAVALIKLLEFHGGDENMRHAETVTALLAQSAALRAERDAAKQIALVSITHGQDVEARAERLEAAIRELKRCWYQGDLTENDFAAALKGADHDRA